MAIVVDDGDDLRHRRETVAGARRSSSLTATDGGRGAGAETPLDARCR
jgi:hypothetical protein